MALRALGGLSLPGVRFSRPKPLLLLTYLALQGPQYRRYLGELFWPHAADARHSLSMALSQLRAAAPELIHSHETRIWTEVECDAVLLLEAATNHEWQRVTELHRGPFLAGVDIDDDNVELEDWLLETREMFVLQVHDALVELAEQHLASGDLRDAAQLAERAAALAPDAGNEPILIERLHALLAATGSPRLRQLRKEARTLGIALPEPASPLRHVTVHNLPGDFTQFIGRRAELAALSELLLQGTRLITITGLGGMGKTRLALELARQLKASGLYDQVFFVPLDAARDPEQLMPLLREAVKSRNGPRGKRASLVGALGSKRTLLLLDNFDHLVASAEKLGELLAQVPHLALLVTSRVPLGLAAETQYPLTGLPLLAGEALLEPNAPAGDALIFYRQIARRYLPNFELDEENAGAVLGICRLVDGAPLSIELAAALSRVIPASELLAELSQNLDVLATDLGHLPARHTSMRALFESSWVRLTDAEQAAFAGTAIFKGGFTRPSARYVLGLQVTLLTSLLDKSLLRRQGSRYELHPLVQQYASEKLAQHPEFEDWRAKHAEYYCAWFDSKRPYDQRSGHRQAFEELALEFPNLQAGWHWAAHDGRHDLLELAMFMVSRFLSSRGNQRELVELLAAAEVAAPPASLLFAQIQRYRGLIIAWEDPVKARDYLDEALAIYLKQGHENAAGALYHDLGTVHAFLGDADRARQYWLDAVPLLQQHDDEQLLGAAYSNISLTAAHADEHESWANRASATCRAKGTTAQLTVCLATQAAQLMYSYGDYDNAVRLLDQAIALENSEIGRSDYLAMFHHLQAYNLVNAGDQARAEERLAEAYRLLGGPEAEIDHGSGQYPSVNWAIAHLHYARGEADAARVVAGKTPDDLLCTELLCRLALERGALDLAEQYLSVLSTLRGYGFSTRARLHERAVEHLLSAELAQRRHGASSKADRDSYDTAEFTTALNELLAALEDVIEFTFTPLALEAFTTAYALEPELSGYQLLWLAAYHPAGRYFVRRRALRLLTEHTEKQRVERRPASGWSHPTPAEILDLARALVDRLRTWGLEPGFG